MGCNLQPDSQSKPQDSHERWWVMFHKVPNDEITHFPITTWWTFLKPMQPNEKVTYGENMFPQNVWQNETLTSFIHSAVFPSVGRFSLFLRTVGSGYWGRFLEPFSQAVFRASSSHKNFELSNFRDGSHKSVLTNHGLWKKKKKKKNHDL